jgi:hypothetical protein
VLVLSAIVIVERPIRSPTDEQVVVEPME